MNGDAAELRICLRFDDHPIFILSQTSGERLHPSAVSLLKNTGKLSAS